VESEDEVMSKYEFFALRIVLVETTLLALLD
jgi:hypothetical protein